jgi:hypothetical protein
MFIPICARQCLRNGVFFDGPADARSHRQKSIGYWLRLSGPVNLVHGINKVSTATSAECAYNAYPVARTAYRRQCRLFTS